MKSHLALLRGINVGGRNRIPMKELTETCSALGWREVETLLQTGNAVFQAAGSAEGLESSLESAILERFGFSISVVVCDAVAFHRLAENSPLAKVAEIQPSRVLLYLTKQRVAPTAEADLAARAMAGEVVAATETALWIHFPNGVGSSKLTPAAIDRAVGSPATGRNWNTVRKLRELLSR